MKFIPNLTKARIILSLFILSLLLVVSPASPASPVLFSSSGNQITLNDQTWPAAWSQWQADVQGQVHTCITDAAIMQLLGVELLDTNDAAKQPVQWFSQVAPLVLDSWIKGGYRYLDVTELAQTAGWQLRVIGNTLSITTPVARVQAIQHSLQSWGDRILINLDRPTTWRERSGGGEEKNISTLFPLLSPTQTWTITIDATLKQPPPLLPSSPLPLIPKGDPEFPLLFHSPTLNVKTTQSQTLLQVNVPDGFRPRITTLSNPSRLAIDFRLDALPSRDILWAPGLRWRQQFVSLENYQFPVVWLEINLLAAGLTLKPIWSNPHALVGTAPLIQTAQLYTAAAAINGGFFNRHEQLPLGAIRRDGHWVSSPILNRGVIAWNDLGKFKIGHLSLQETLTKSLALLPEALRVRTLTTPLGERLPILSLNSGYTQAGIARYTSDWGSTYTPLNDDEVIAVVEHQQVIAQLPGGAAGKAAFPIPINGYLLVIRDRSAAAQSLPTGTVVSLDTTTPPDFAPFPQILGAGPILVQNQQIVLDAKAEQFSNAFIKETAPRSAICTTASGTLLIAAVHNRSGGVGPTLAELARVLQQMECVDALNLDGGSSTSLYLGGQLLDRSPSTAARVHNGLGVFLEEKR